MVVLKLTLLGGFEARLSAGDAVSLPTKKAQALLAYLGLQPEHAHQRDKLASLLWGNRSDEHARDGFRHALFALRKALRGVTPPALLTEGQTLTLNAAVVDVDVATFQRRMAEGTPQALEQAAELYRGDLLLGFTVSEPLFEEWLVTERERLREMALEALARLLAHQTKSGGTERAIQTAVRLLGLDPLQEAVHRTLMRLYARQGRRGAALKQYQVCVEVLQRELGAEPEAETKRLYQELLRRRAKAVKAAASLGHNRTRPAPKAALARLDLPMAETALIGREVELGRLRQLLDQMIRGRGHLAAVMGEAGIGKTRLLSALAVEALQRGCQVLIGRCHESDSILPFGPWVDACRSGELTGDEEIFSALRAAWRAELSRLFPEATAAGLPSPSNSDLRLFEAVAQFVEQVAARQPLVLMLEDLHWADEMSLRLLAFVSRRIPKWAALLVTTARVEELADSSVAQRTVQELSREAQAVPLVLPPLSRPATTRLVHALVRAGSDARTLARLEEQVWAVSEGNPFVAVETTRALEDGTVVPQTGTLHVPQQVRELIATRLDRLSDRARELAYVAAVIGREFEFALLQRASGLDEHTTAKGVEELVRRRVLRGTGERFDFSHSRVQAVAYDQLLPPQRRLRHRRVGEAVETQYADNLDAHYLAIGTHFREGEVWDKAAAYLQRAANAAVGRSAYREGLAGFEQALVALAYLPDGREKYERGADLHSQIRQALHPLGDDQAIIEHLRQAEALATTLGDRRRLAMALAQITQHHWQVGEFDQGLKVGERALAIAEALGEVDLVLEITQYLGQMHRDRGDATRAKEIFAQYVDLFDGDRLRVRLVGTGYPAVSFPANLASCHAILGEFAAGIARGAQALRLAEEIDHPLSINNACRWFAHVYLLKGDLESAVPLLQRALELTRSRGQGEVATRAKARLGYAWALSGHVAEAVTMLEDLRSPAGVKRRSLWPLSSIWLAEAYALSGLVDDAEAEARRALTLAGQQQARGDEAWALLVLGEIAARREPPDGEKSEDHCLGALELANELGMRPLVARCHLGLANLYRRTGKREQAQEHLAIATTMYREMGMTYWLEKAEAELR